MSCDRCGSDQVINVSVNIEEFQVEGGGLDYVGTSNPYRFLQGGEDECWCIFGLCLGCGKMQGNFPLEPTVHDGIDFGI